MKILSGSIRSKLMLGSAFVAAAVLATPAAMAHDRYYHGSRTSDVLGALVVGAVIGGVVASASSHRDRYYYDSGYYAPPSYYGYTSYSYPAYDYPAYPSYGYGGYYGSGVNVGVYYSNRSSGWRGYDRGSHYSHSRGYYGSSYGYDRGSHGYYGGSHGYQGGSRGYYGGSHGYSGGSRGYQGGSHGSSDRRGNDRDQGHYYSRGGR